MISKKELLEKMAEIQQKGYRVHQWNEVMSWAESLPDDQPDLLPFQWPVPDGMEVVTRDGRKVEQLTEFMYCKVSYAGVLSDGVLCTWSINGQCYVDGHLDLFLRRKEKKVWLVEWEAHNGFSGKNYFDTINEAQELCNRDEKHHSSATIYEATLQQINQQINQQS